MSKSIPSFIAIKHDVDKLVPMGLSELEIFEKFKRSLEDLSPTDLTTLKSYVAQAIEEHGSYHEVQAYMSGTLLAAHDHKDGYFLLNKHEHTKRFVKKSVLKDILSPKLDIKSRIIPCYFDYRPEVNKELFTEDGKTLYNSYEPPFWFKKSFYDGVKMVSLKTPPDIYTRLLTHLLDGDKPSIDYVTKWLATSLQSRNRCYLTTIGNQGIGKGVLGAVMKALHGADNFSEILFSDIQEKKFNSIFVNKRLIYLDEISIKTKKQEDLVKMFANDNMEAEYKGVDSKMVRNYASIYTSSNNIDSLRLSADDRRFSIVQMTSVPLRNVFSQEDFAALMEPKNLELYAAYLMGLKVSEMEMLHPFISSRTQMVREASITDLEDYIINQYAKENAGSEMDLGDFQNHLSEKFGAKYKPNAGYLSALAQRMPGYYVIHRPKVEGARPRKIKFTKLDSQPLSTEG